MEPLALFFAFAVALCVAILRGVALGDLPPALILRSSSLWGLGTFLALGIPAWILARYLVPANAMGAVGRARKGKTAGAPKGPREKTSRARREIPPEILNQAEEETPRIERPMPPRVSGVAPAEVAEALRSISEKGV